MRLERGWAKAAWNDSERRCAMVGVPGGGRPAKEGRRAQPNETVGDLLVLGVVLTSAIAVGWCLRDALRFLGQ